MRVMIAPLAVGHFLILYRNDSPFGAVAGSYIIGVGISLLSAYVHQIGPELQLPVALGVLVVVLVLRPAGLFGRVVVRRV